MHKWHFCKNYSMHSTHQQPFCSKEKNKKHQSISDDNLSAPPSVGTRKKTKIGANEGPQVHKLFFYKASMKLTYCSMAFYAFLPLNSYLPSPHQKNICW